MTENYLVKFATKSYRRNYLKKIPKFVMASAICDVNILFKLFLTLSANLEE